MPAKGVNSSHSGQSCSVIVAVEDDADGGFCKPSISPEMIDDSTEHQKEPNQSQIEPQSSSAGVEGEFTETEGQVPDADTADGPGEGYNEEGGGGGGDVFGEIPGDSEVVMVEGREEQEGSQKRSPELDDPSERQRSERTSPEPPAAANGEQTCGAAPEPGADEGEPEQTEADVGAETQSAGEARLKEDNSAEADSRVAVSEAPESLTCRETDHIWKRECRSTRPVKVLRPAALASL